MASPLQTILRSTYFEAWKKRNVAANELGRCLSTLRGLREELDERQAWLESIAAEWKASGFEDVDDYLTRVWPVARPSEREIDPNGPVAEIKPTETESPKG